MNNLFQRTKIGSNFLISDSDLNVDTAFYPPNFEDESNLDIGNNDPDKVGAIATANVGGEITAFIYQGNFIWSKIGSFSPIPPDIIPFTATGGFTIDFTIANRNILYNNPTIYAYIVDGNTETKIQGMSEIINRSGGVIQSVDLDGLFGTGYILIKQ